MILPGAFTILLLSKNNPRISKLVQQDSNLIGIRIIDKNFCNAIINSLQNPIVTTSINIHGEDPLIHIEKIEERFNNKKIFWNKRKLDSKGSTILDLNQDPIKIVRLGKGKISETFS